VDTALKLKAAVAPALYLDLCIMTCVWRNASIMTVIIIITIMVSLSLKSVADQQVSNCPRCKIQRLTMTLTFYLAIRW